MKINNKGFTLVELLGVFVILGIIMLVAIPNVMGILDRNKKNTFVEHAKEMIALTEYKMASDNTIAKVGVDRVIIFTLRNLDSDDIKTSVNGIEYDEKQSFVVVYNSPIIGRQYYVSLREQSNSNKQMGLELISQADLNKSNAMKQVVEMNDTYCITCTSLRLPDGRNVSIQTLYR